MADVPTITLNDGVEIPQLGFGTYQVDPGAAAQVCADALALGYRHIDTAQMYANEAGVGAAVRASGLARDEVFITSKLNNPNHDPARARASFDETLAALDTDHVDLFLIHWPMPKAGGFLDAWQILEEFKASGRARSIGVSNFQREHLEAIVDAGLTVPSVNQIEVHPGFDQDDLRAFGAGLGIVTEAWAPLAQGRILDDATITRIADRLGRTPAQIALRWSIQRGDVVFPKSTHHDRIAENFAVFDFELPDDDMAAISALDTGGRIGAHPDDIN